MKRRLLRWKHNVSAITIVLFCILVAANTTADDGPSPEERGLEIAREAWERERGYGDSAAEMYMILRTGTGQEARREMRLRSLEVSENESRALIIFDAPPDVRGTALLTHSFNDQEDNQWLYLPAAGAERRIAGGSRSGPFMGSEFAFEDLSVQRVEHFTYRYIGEETLNDTPCHVIERFPADTASGYKRQVAWLDKEHYRVQKVDYYDRRDELLKTLAAEGYQQYEGKFWRPASMTMHNHQNGRSTVLEWRNITFDNDFTTRMFDRSAIRRAR